ncbi:hypothetical protein Tco_0605760 [Tanacetum coccineum]
MVISSPCLIDNKELTSPEQTAPALASPKQTAIGKDFSNPLIVDSLLKTIWSSMHHVFTMKHWLVQSKRLLHSFLHNRSYPTRLLTLLFMANLEFCDKHNMVAFLEKSTGSEGFHQVIDFLNQSHICYALTKKPDVYVSFIKQFWRSAEATTDDNGEVQITATIDGHSMTITEASLRRHLKLDDHDGITSIPNSEIFEQLALMGYHTDSDKLTFQKGAFSPQWRFLIHTILHCLSPKKTAWEQFSSNIATAVICLATNRRFNFSRLIFEHMVSNISSPHKFLMYPRFIQICLDMQRKQLQQHSRTYPVPSLSIKVFNNMKRPTKGYSGQEVALFPTMLNVSEPSTSPSRITSSPSPSPEPSPSHSPEPSTEHSPDHTTAAVSFPSPTQPTQPSPETEQHIPTPHDSPLHAVHSHGSDEGSLKLIELTNLVTKLSKRIGILEDDLKKTKLTYSAAVTKLILRVKKLEFQVKTGKARKRARVVLSEDDKDVEDDSSKQGRKSDAEVQGKASTKTEPIIQEVTPTKVIQDQGSSEKGNYEVSTAGATKGTTSEVPMISTAEENISTAGRTVTYRRRCEEERTRKDKGKAIMTEPEPKKKSKKELEQERLSFAEAIRLQEQMDEDQRAHIARDEEIARQWNEEEEQRVMSEAKSTKKIDWNDPSVIRLIFEKVWDFNQHIEPIEHGSEKIKSPEKIEEEDVDTQKEMKEVSKESGVKRKKSLPRKNTISTVKRQKMEEETKKEDLKGYLDIVPKEEFAEDVESLSIKYPIMDWKTCVLIENFMYYQIFRGDGSSKNYKVLNLHTLFEPDGEDEIWKNQHEYNLISWSLYDFCGIHILLMQNGIAIHMLIEKKYPLSQEMLLKMLSKRLEADHESTQAFELLKFIRSQDYALWEVIENGNSWVHIPVTSPAETGTSTGTKMAVPSTAEEKMCKKNDVKAKSLLLMALPNEHQLTFDQLQRLVSRLEILGVVTPLEDLNKVKKSAGASNDAKNLAFLTASGVSNTNDINTVNPEVSTATTKVKIVSTEISTASFSDAIVYAFLSTQPQGSQLVHEDLEQLHDDDLEEMDLKWNMALLSMRARKFYQRTERKIIIDGSNTAGGYDKS